MSPAKWGVTGADGCVQGHGLRYMLLASAQFFITGKDNKYH